MTPPPAVIKNRTYLFTRRCANRHFFLRPSKKVNQAFVYCYAVAARDKWRRIELLPRCKQSVAAYRKALAAWKALSS